MRTRASWGEPRLFAEADPPGEQFRVRVLGGSFGPVVASLALAVAQARAVAVDGRTAEIGSVDGTVAAVQQREDRFVVTPWGPALWPSRCERLLVEHG